MKVAIVLAVILSVVLAAMAFPHPEEKKEEAGPKVEAGSPLVAPKENGTVPAPADADAEDREARTFWPFWPYWGGYRGGYGGYGGGYGGYGGGYGGYGYGGSPWFWG